MKRLSKKQAFDMIKGSELPQDDKEQLMRFFLPATPKKTTNKMQWLGRIVDPKDVRVYLRYIYVSNGRACTTNGHVLLWTTTDLTDGYYCPKLHTPVDVELKYPDIDPVIKAQSGLCKNNIHVSELKTNIVNSSLTTLEGPNHVPNKPGVNGVCERYNKAYIDKASNGEDVPLKIHDVAARGICSLGEFIVMGLRD